MVKVIISYRLRDGVSREQYHAWSREVDQQIAARQPGVQKYEIYDIKGSGTEAAPYCEFVEVIEATSWEAWQKVNGYEEMKPVVEAWLKLCDPASVQVVYGTKV